MWIPPIYLTDQVLSQLAAVKLKQLPLNGPELWYSTFISLLKNRTCFFMLPFNRGALSVKLNPNRESSAFNNFTQEAIEFYE